MTTIKLKVNNDTLDKLRQFIKDFHKDEIEVLEELNDFESLKSEVNEDLVKYESGESKAYSIDEADAFLEETIKHYES